MVYANHAGTSWPKPESVHRAIAAALEASPTEGERIFEASRDVVCRALGIDSPDRFLFTASCTSALSVALGDLPWESGDGIITSALEHHALARPVAQLVQHRGVRHHIAPYRPGAPVDLDFVRDRLAAGGVRCVAMTAASNVTGELLPIETVVSLAHEHGALCLVDAAQTFGVIPTNVRDLGADILTFAGHKGPHGPQGIGGLWAAPHVTFDSPQAKCSVAEGAACGSFPGYCDVGSVNVAGAAGLAAGIEWRSRLEHDAAREQARHLIDEIRDVDGCDVIAPESERTATVSIRLRDLAVADAERLFLEHGVILRAGAHCAPMALDALGLPDGTLRFSFGPTTTDADRKLVSDAIVESVVSHR